MPAATRPRQRTTPDHQATPAALFRAAEPDAEAERALALQQMPTGWLECRGERHDLEVQRGYGVKVYDTERATDMIQVNWAWRRGVCRRCGYEVETWYDQVFRRVTSFGKHPEGYLLHGMGRAHPAEARQVLWARTEGPQPTPGKAKGKGKGKAA